MIFRVLVTLALGVMMVTQSVHARVSDPVAEKEMTDLISDQLVVGDIHWLEADGLKFMSVHARTDKPARGTVIVIHNLRHHTNTLELVEPLSRDLLEYGWDTLYIQMPVLSTDTGMRDHAVVLDESPARIRAAIKFLKGQGAKNMVIVGHGFGAIMGAAYLIETGDKDIRALVGIGWFMLNYTDPRMWTPDSIKQLHLPILDIFGTDDRHGVARVRDVRARAAQEAGNKLYRQIEVVGADHDFLYKSDILAREIANWLNGL